MYQYIIEAILGTIAGITLGMTGIHGTGLILIILDYLNIGEYKSNLGAIALLNSLPITFGSFFNYYKANKINYQLALILSITIAIGAYFGSNFVVGDKINLSKKTIKYITSILGFIIGISFLISAQNEKN